MPGLDGTGPFWANGKGCVNDVNNENINNNYVRPRRFFRRFGQRCGFGFKNGGWSYQVTNNQGLSNEPFNNSNTTKEEKIDHLKKHVSNLEQEIINIKNEINGLESNKKL